MIAMFALTSFIALSGPGHSGDVWSLWRAYVEYFVNASGCVIDHSNGDHMTSEGQYYALFFALVVHSRKRFVQLLRWTEDNLSAGRLENRLLAWFWEWHNGFILGRCHFLVDGALYPSWEYQCINQ
ncbi:MAG: hypothetical protein JW915_01755 [Chitinispirillaceae bacterium]|nr:hypothetical protein [Chitinispirillaceae bacterium]